ncbi:MAG: divalent metal cation transporter [Acidobacteriia bacterium]|nr:divalent metal cation transporter [Terriglobia bacterium]
MRVLIFLAVLGPGIITASVDNDSGGIYTYSVAGAVVTGKGLADLIREEYGLRTTFIIMVLLLVTNLGNTISEFAGLASGMSVFGVSRFVAVPLGALFVWVLVVRGTYRIVESVFLGACVFYVVYPISSFMTDQNWSRAFLSTVKPSIEFNASYFYMLTGLVGTTIAPWMQFYLQSAMVEKGIKLKNYVYSKWDVMAGCFVTDIVAFFIIVACAATIFASGHRHIGSAADAALALRPLAGHAASALFAFGLVNASLFSASILPLSTAYSVCEGLGLEAGINKRFREAPAFYWLYTALIVLSASTVMILSESKQIPIILLSQVTNGLLLPFVLIFMLKLSNRVDLMGTYRNTRSFNVIAWGTCLVMIAMTVLLVTSAFFPARIPA